MTTKHKLSRKRGSEHLGDASKVIEGSEITISRSKRRKGDNSNIYNFEKQESLDTQLPSCSQTVPHLSQHRCPNKFTYPDKGGKTSSLLSVLNKEKYSRSRFKKTLSNIGILSREKKAKRNKAASNILFTETSKDGDCGSATDGRGKEKQKLASDSANRLLGASGNMTVSDCEEGSHHHVCQVSYSNSGLGKRKRSMICPSVPDVKTVRTPGQKCKTGTAAGEHKVTDSGYSKGICNSTLTSLIHAELSSHINHSHIPVLKPVAEVTEISSTTSSMPSLSASTSATTVVSTPIPTLLKLPDPSGADLVKMEDDTHPEQATPVSERNNSLLGTSQQVHEPDPDCNPDEERHKLDLCPQQSHHIQKTALPWKNTDSSSGHPSLWADKSSEPCQASQEDDVSDIKIDLPSLETMSSTNSQQPNFLQVNTWAAHMLRNLELLYENERHCDLTLKFCGGELLKVHRTVLLACTSLVSELDAVRDRNEVVVPADLSFANVEPVIRFLYSGRMEVQKSASEMSAIYIAARRLKVPLLTYIMDHHFPYLSHTESFTSQGNTEYLKDKSSEETSIPIPALSQAFPGSSLKGSHCTSAANKDMGAAPVGDEQDVDTKSLEDMVDVESIKTEECDEVQDAPMYYFVNDSSTDEYEYIPADGPRRCMRSEEARPTRFELEEDSENFSRSSISSPRVPRTSQNVTHSPLSSSASVGCSISSEMGSLGVSSLFKGLRKSSPSHNVKKKKNLLHITGYASCEDQMTVSANAENQSSKLRTSSESSKCGNVADIHEDYQMTDNESTAENVELKEKVSSICKQLEEKEPNSQIQGSNLKGDKSDDRSLLPSTDKKEPGNDKHLIENSVTQEVAVPVKSILKKSKNKSSVKKDAKHVSFQLDENNELINEVAIFSLSKEPAESLIEVHKIKENRKSLRDTHSQVKLTVSRKKKMLMNLSKSDSEAIGSSSVQCKKSFGKKNVSSSQSHSKHHAVNKGDINTHAKMISELLKKYPNIVKDKKEIHLRIIKKGNEKGGKGKSKVQYLRLHEGDSKSVTKVHKAASFSKDDSNVPQRGQEQYTFKCPECNNITFKSYFMLKKHVSDKHKDKISEILSHIENIPYACYICFVNEPLEFGDYYSYQQHMKDVHSKTELRLCNICGFKPRHKFKLEFAYHMYTEHNKVSRSFCFPKCDLCDHVAINDAALLKHRSQHTNADKYTCSVCDMKFCSLGALQGHMQTKLCQTKPSVSHACPHCPLIFARSYNLKAHLRSCHKSLQSTLQSTFRASEKQSQDLMPRNARTESEGAGENYVLKNNSKSVIEKENMKAEVECETLPAANTNSSSETEALSTAASSSTASLDLPEEIVKYVCSEVDNIGYSDTMVEESVEQVSQASQTVDLASHFEASSALENEDHTHSNEKHGVKTSARDCTNKSALPFSVVPSEVLSGHVSELQVLEVEGMKNPNGLVVGSDAQSLTNVTCQAPSTSDAVPFIITETTSVNAPSGKPHLSKSTKNMTVEDIEVTASDTIRCAESVTNTCNEDVTSFSRSGNEIERDINISQISSFPETHTHDS